MEDLQAPRRSSGSSRTGSGRSQAVADMELTVRLLASGGIKFDGQSRPGRASVRFVGHHFHVEVYHVLLQRAHATLLVRLIVVLCEVRRRGAGEEREGGEEESLTTSDFRLSCLRSSDPVSICTSSQAPRLLRRVPHVECLERFHTTFETEQCIVLDVNNDHGPLERAAGRSASTVAASSRRVQRAMPLLLLQVVSGPSR